MTSQLHSEPDYGNWVSFRIIFGPLIIGLVFLAFAVFFPVVFISAAGFFLIALLCVREIPLLS